MVAIIEHFGWLRGRIISWYVEVRRKNIDGVFIVVKQGRLPGSLNMENVIYDCFINPVDDL